MVWDENKMAGIANYGESPATRKGSMISITNQQRRAAFALITKAMRALATLAEARNLDHEARQAVNRARDEISSAETLIANQPTQ